LVENRIQSIAKSFFFPLWVAAVITPFIIVATSSHYFFNPHAFGSLFVSYFVGALGILIANKGFEQDERWQLFLLSVCFFFWLWITSLGYFCKPTERVLAASLYKVANIPVIFIATQIRSFTRSFLKLERQRTVIAGYLLALVFTVLNIFTSYFFGETYHYSWGLYPHWHFIRSIPFFIYFSAGLVLSQIELIKAHKHCENQRTKNQIKYITVAFGIAYLGIVDYLPCFGYNVYPCGYIAILGWWTILAYAILKHRLMDITIIIRKTLIYSVVMGSLMGAYLMMVTLFSKLFAGYTGYQTIFSPALAAGLITVCFQPLRKRVQAFVDAKFFRQYVDREEKLYELSREVITHTTPEAMGKALQQVLMETFHPKNGVLYVRSRDGAGFSAATQWGEMPAELIPEDNAMARYFLDHPQPFLPDLSGDVGMPLNTRDTEERGRNT